MGDHLRAATMITEADHPREEVTEGVAARPHHAAARPPAMGAEEVTEAAADLRLATAARVVAMEVEEVGTAAGAAPPREADRPPEAVATVGAPPLVPTVEEEEEEDIADVHPHVVAPPQEGDLHPGAMEGAGAEVTDDEKKR